MGFTKEFFEMIVKKYGDTSYGSEKDDSPDNFFYLYYEDMTESDGHGAHEEHTFKIRPLDGVLEVTELEIEDFPKTKDIARDYIPYEKIIRFYVGICYGTEQ
jgi:hypothetical protein